MKQLRNGRKVPPPPMSIRMDLSSAQVTVDGVIPVVDHASTVAIVEAKALALVPSLCQCCRYICGHVDGDALSPYRDPAERDDVFSSDVERWADERYLDVAAAFGDPDRRLSDAWANHQLRLPNASPRAWGRRES
jgi:hypothetical protein